MGMHWAQGKLRLHLSPCVTVAVHASSRTSEEELIQLKVFDRGMWSSARDTGQDFSDGASIDGAGAGQSNDRPAVTGAAAGIDVSLQAPPPEQWWKNVKQDPATCGIVDARRAAVVHSSSSRSAGQCRTDCR